MITKPPPDVNPSGIYGLFTNTSGLSPDELQGIAGFLNDAQTERLARSDFSPEKVYVQLIQHKRLVVLVGTDGDCHLNANAGAGHFITITDIYFDNGKGCWMARYYDPYYELIKEAPFGRYQDTTLENDPYGNVSSLFSAANKFGCGGFYVKEQ